jgi:hypothetical protein
LEQLKQPRNVYHFLLLGIDLRLQSLKLTTDTLLGSTGLRDSFQLDFKKSHVCILLLGCLDIRASSLRDPKSSRDTALFDEIDLIPDRALAPRLASTGALPERRGP